MHITYYLLSDLILIIRAPSIWPIMMGLWVLYSLKSPYRLAKKRGFTYGTTPLSVWILVASCLKKGQTLVDLGSGTGFGLFYISKLFKIKCIGVDVVDEFIQTGNYLAHRYKIEGVSFIKADLAQFSLPSADAIYLAGTCMNDELLTHIAFECEKTRPEIIFSISTSLEEYGLKSYAVEEKSIRMAWGWTSIFIMKLLK